jgi:hypothetical protein
MREMVSPTCAWCRKPHLREDLSREGLCPVCAGTLTLCPECQSPMTRLAMRRVRGRPAKILRCPKCQRQMMEVPTPDFCQTCSAPFPEYFNPDDGPPLKIYPASPDHPSANLGYLETRLGHCRRCGTMLPGLFTDD